MSVSDLQSRSKLICTLAYIAPWEALHIGQDRTLCRRSLRPFMGKIGRGSHGRAEECDQSKCEWPHGGSVGHQVVKETGR
jgi:hypothetical protein